MAHAFVYTGDREAGIRAAEAYAADVLGLAIGHNPDVMIFRYGLFSVDDARRFIRIAEQAAVGSQKLMAIAPERIFHEAQNALLKVFEEPPVGTTLVLIVPSAGVLLGTLRSRLIPLAGDQAPIPEEVVDFLSASSAAREKLIAKLLERTKSDKEEEKQAARGDALRLVEGIAAAAYRSYQEKGNEEDRRLLYELERFIPILHERSAPLKLMFEHILLVLPRRLRA